MWNLDSTLVLFKSMLAHILEVIANTDVLSEWAVAGLWIKRHWLTTPEEHPVICSAGMDKASIHFQQILYQKHGNCRNISELDEICVSSFSWIRSSWRNFTNIVAFGNKKLPKMLWRKLRSSWELLSCIPCLCLNLFSGRTPSRY